MRFVSSCALLVAVFLALAAPALAQKPGEEEERERQAKALLLLAQAHAKCAPNIEAGRKEAVKDDKPLVVLVGKTSLGCGEVADLGAIGVKVKEYKADAAGSTTPAAPRVIVLTKGSGQPTDPDTSSLYIREVLKPDATAKELEAAVRKVAAARAAPAAKHLDWQAGTPSGPAVTNGPGR